ncbi:4-hydroxybutyrate--acetyl-CoA CoA transferase [Anaerosalibacter bizertensis]|uniref:4-hydroxybutyrate--acetyl-CoA CoA transferase n=1 Tax=Anaerosalibacter bizertensis TaxID=932217 RepID=A0A844FHE1_9FIRM|nr:acetyl-CoA hydrolase/transferase C-terminal domain-containing protein [Anaerosalibacter bizertensis]MSS43335.1 4-hydroxybutyrate--acetyl-CoA CoA transferase [Anaerosalibacter bizertensis]
MEYFKKIYKDKTVTVDEALRLIKSNDVIIAAQAAAEPMILLENLHKVKDNGVSGVQLQTCLPVGNYEVMKNPEYKDVVFNHGWYFTKALREAHKKGNATFTPQHAHIAVWKKLSGIKDRRVVLFCTCSPMDKHGYMSLSISNIYEKDLIDAGAYVICEVSPNYPRTFGDNIVHVSQVDAIVESNREVPEINITPYTDVDRKIGQNIAELVENGSTIQLGVGNIPNAVANELKVKRHLGIHTEMFTETMVDLIECGAVDNSQKGFYDGYSVCAFAFGSRKLYDFLDDNPTVLFKSGSWVNDPFQIKNNKKFTSINASLEIDLTGQCASESIGSIQYSGTGGQADTVIGSQRSEGGKSIIAMHSTYKTKDELGNEKLHSKILPFLKQGSIVSLSRNDVDYVVTEYGVAWLRGLSVKDRVDALINIAHPDFRDWLRFEANKNQIW